jgi:HPt (histidine-containing phosphotransfer) domain-containing protein
VALSEDKDKDQLPDVHVWNAGTLNEIVCDNAGMHSRLLDKFLKNAETQVKAMNDAIQAGNLQRLAKIAHPLKSAARTVGAFALGDLCERIEVAATAKDSSVSFALTMDLSCTFDRVKGLIHAHLDTLDDTKV